MRELDNRIPFRINSFILERLASEIEEEVARLAERRNLRLKTESTVTMTDFSQVT